MTEIQSIGRWATNGDLIAEVARLGWIADGLTVLDIDRTIRAARRREEDAA